MSLGAGFAGIFDRREVHPAQRKVALAALAWIARREIVREERLHAEERIRAAVAEKAILVERTRATIERLEQWAAAAAAAAAGP